MPAPEPTHCEPGKVADCVRKRFSFRVSHETPSLPELLKLSSEVDLDALTNTTRSMVAEFSEEVVPFALELSQSLVSPLALLEIRVALMVATTIGCRVTR